MIKYLVDDLDIELIVNAAMHSQKRSELLELALNAAKTTLVTHCKDCRYKKESGEDFIYCTITSLRVPEYGYCHRGKDIVDDARCSTCVDIGSTIDFKCSECGYKNDQYDTFAVWKCCPGCGREIVAACYPA